MQRSTEPAAADVLANAWISEHYPGAISHSFTESPEVSTSRKRWNETSWLIFDAERGQVTIEAVHYRSFEHMF